MRCCRSCKAVLPKGSQISLSSYLWSHFSHNSISTTCKTQPYSLGHHLWLLSGACAGICHVQRFLMSRPAVFLVLVIQPILWPRPIWGAPCSPSNLHYTNTQENRLLAIISLITMYCALVIYIRVSTCISVSQMPAGTNTRATVPPHVLLSAEFLQPVFPPCCSVHRCAKVKFIARFIQTS